MSIDAGDALSPVKRALLEIRELRAASWPSARGRGARADRHRRHRLRLPGGVDDAAAFVAAAAAAASTRSPRSRPTAGTLDALYRCRSRRAGQDDHALTAASSTTSTASTPSSSASRRARRQSMDPQQRLLLEVAWEALEDAAIAPSSLTGSAHRRLRRHRQQRLRPRAVRRTATPSMPTSAPAAPCSVAAGRLSYFLGLPGPSIAVDTACSSSLVALHLACQGLRARRMRRWRWRAAST